MNTYQEHNSQENGQNRYTGYTGYAQAAPENPYNQLYEDQQQEYQEPYQQQHIPPMDNGYYGYDSTKSNSSMLPGISGSFAAGFSYIGLWLTGLLFLIFEQKNRLVRFHAMQSLLFFGGVNVLYIVLISIMANQTPFVWGFAVFAFVIMNIIAAVSWFVGLIGAFSGKYTKLPLVGDIAENYVNRTTPTSPRM